MNGCPVVEVDAFKDWIDIGDEVVREKEVKSIVTKQQFANIEYKLEV